MLLSASKANNGNRKLDDDSDKPGDHELLFAEGDPHEYISRLEAIVESDIYTDSTDGKSENLFEAGELVALGVWMERKDGTCLGESCDQCDIPEEYKVAAPKVDVMSFLGIRRAQPLQVSRDWD